MNKYKILAAVVATALMSVAGGAAAQATGGGASLPADLYKGSSDSILPANFSYAVTGSGTGKSAFLTNNAVPFGTTGTVHFAGSDSVLSGTGLVDEPANSELGIYNDTYNNPAKPATYYGPLLQFPSVATSVTIPFNQAGSAGLVLTNPQLCGIFSGVTTKWEDIAGSGRTGPLVVVYRPESSGTSELLTRFLSGVCGAQAGSTLKNNGTFSVQSTFKNLFVSDTAPANFVVASDVGGTALYNTVYATGGSIGYVGPDVIPNLADTTKVAALRVGTAAISPIEENVQTALGTRPVPEGDDIANPAKWVPVFSPAPTVGYPIVGYTNFIVGQCYKSGTVTTQLRLFLNRHYGAANATDAAVRAHGFIPLTPEWKTAIRTYLVSASEETGLGNTTTCGTGNDAIGRPQ